MSQFLRNLLIGIGVSSIVASVVLFCIGKNFIEYFPGFFIGITLIGTVLLEQKKQKGQE